MSPASIVGGTWSKIENRFLYCSNDTTTGGENSFTKNFDHNHYMTLSATGAGWDYDVNQNGISYHHGDASVPNKPVLTACSIHSQGNQNYGPDEIYGGSEGKPLGEVEFNNMPAYQSVYCWRRTA